MVEFKIEFVQITRNLVTFRMKAKKKKVEKMKPEDLGVDMKPRIEVKLTKRKESDFQI